MSGLEFARKLKEKRALTRRHRSRVDMFADILKETDAVTAKGGEPMKKTWIMYRANLSYDQLNLYLDYLVENKLLGKVGSTEYQTTEKGRNFLKAYSEMNELLKLIVK